MDLKIKNATLVQEGRGAINFVLQFRDFDFIGYRDSKILDARGWPENFDGTIAEMSVKAPKFTLIGPYTINGNLLLLPIQGSGTSNVTLNNLVGRMKFRLKKVIKDGEVYASAEKLKLNINISRMYMEFENLFNGNPELEQYAKQFLNENWKLVFEDIKPSAMKTFGQIWQDILNHVLSRIPCLIQSSEEVLRSAGNGFPGLNLIPIDPLRVDKVDIRQNSESPVNINLFFRDIILNGLSQLKVYKMQGFVENPRKIEMRARLDKLVLNANYKARGRILLLPINGEGKCNLTFDNWDAGWRFTVNKVEKNNKEYVKVENSKLFFNTTRLHMDFENLFNGDRALSDNMNQFLNENWNVILTELKPALTDAISQILQNVISGPFSKIPYNELFNAPEVN
uniref:Uncharacterized protein n=1 Tax=Lutzomyia longipalpis TaxID=7200 RepID=A0A1B0EV46_LUTLO